MTDDNWHVMTQSRGGTVSLLRNLTEEAAGTLVERLTPKYQSGMMYHCNEGDLIRVEGFGPDGKTIGGRC